MTNRKGRIDLRQTVLLLGCALAFNGSTSAQVPQGKIPGPNVKPPIPPIVKECRDPAAESLTFQILQRDPERLKGRIRITGVVRNLGNAEFESDPLQASIRLTETPQGGAPVKRAEQRIRRLAPQEALTVPYETSWDTAREFPPKYTLSIDYDPDIRSDANRKNDDCNTNNNRRELTGEQINRGWR